MQGRLMSKVPLGFQDEGIERIELQDDEAETGGAFLLLYRELEPECAFDEWYPSIAQAKSVAFRRWGVRESDWLTVE